MYREQFNAIIKSAAPSLSELPAHTIGKVMDLLAEGSISLDRGVPEDLSVIEYFKKIGVELKLFSRGSGSQRVFRLKEPDQKLITTLEVFDGTYAVFIDKHFLDVYDDSTSAHYTVESLQRALKADVSSLIPCTLADLEGIGVDAEDWNADDIVTWFKQR